MRVDPELLREFSRTVARASDELSAMDVRGRWESAGTACNGTAMVAGMASQAHTENESVKTHAANLDALASAVKCTAEVVERADDASCIEIKAITSGRS